MGKQINVSSFSEMERVAKRLKTSSENYTRIYKDLMKEANTMGSAWQGADNQAFVNQINGFTQELQAMAKKLLQAGNALEQQKTNYVNRQDSNICQVKKLVN